MSSTYPVLPPQKNDKGTLKSILEQAHVELKDFLKYLSSFLF